jgi:hypothetical protein
VRAVSSKVRLPELPDARMDTRKPIANSPKTAAKQERRPISSMMAESKEKVNDLWRRISQLLRKFGCAHTKKNATTLAGQARAVEREAVEIAQHGDGSIFDAKILPCQRLQLLAGDRFDGIQDFVQRIKAPEI